MLSLTAPFQAVSIAMLLAALFFGAVDGQEWRGHNRQELDGRSAALMKKASTSPTGEAGEKLDDFGSHWLLLMARARTGESEMHQNWADEVVVRSGEVRLVVGGEMNRDAPLQQPCR